MHQVSITGKHPVIVVAVDGHEISTAVRAALYLDAATTPTLHLTLAPHGLAADVVADVLLDRPTTDALIAMGWTPPPGGKDQP
jgi:hypothetical protein